MALKMKTINLYENRNQILEASVDKIVVEIINKRVNKDYAQTILLTGCSPLAGTTSTSISLGIAMANSQKRTLLIDCDVRKALKYKKLNAETTVGLANYLLDFEGNDVELENIVYATNINNLSYIPCGVYSENATRILCSDRMGNLIDILKQQYDCILFDLPSLTIVPDAQVFFKCVDGIVLLAALGETRKQQIKDAKMKIKLFGDKYYGMIINKIPLDVYRRNVKNFDYYLMNKKGEQKLNGNTAYKKYKKREKKNGGEKRES